MKNKKLTMLKIAIVAVLGVATVAACKKKELLKQDTVKVSQENDLIKELKIFYSSLTLIPVESISYNTETQYFVWKGVNQATKEQLKLAYEQSKNAKSN